GMEGRCQCGQITFVTPTDKPQAIFICHCLECRHQSSSAYGISAIFPAFNIEAPNPSAIAVYSRPSSTGETRGTFCTTCGSRLMHQHISFEGTLSPRVAVKAGCLDGLTKDMLRTAMHIWTKRAITSIPECSEAYDEDPPRS
ncbi:hypothetical protein BAUCODRAFT_72953, partial [Baudoinia panamericana UAMH 10762]